MSKQLHKNFTDGQLKSLFEKYSKKIPKKILDSLGGVIYLKKDFGKTKLLRNSNLNLVHF